MFVLPSRGRPHNIRRLSAACQGMTTPILLRLDEDDPTLGDYKAPGWNIQIGPRCSLSVIYNDVFRSMPNLDFYGFIADDVVPETHGWDSKLIEAAGNDGMAVPAGGETTGGCPHFVLGGDLVRSVGWLSLPGLDRLYIDTAWGDIAKARGVYRYLPNVILAHHHFSNGKALMDSTYRKRNKESDKALYEAFKLSLETKNGHSL